MALRVPFPAEAPSPVAFRPLPKAEAAEEAGPLFRPLKRRPATRGTPARAPQPKVRRLAPGVRGIATGSVRGTLFLCHLCPFPRMIFLVATEIVNGLDYNNRWSSRTSANNRESCFLAVVVDTPADETEEDPKDGAPEQENP